jgi:hypothetical protein
MNKVLRPLDYLSSWLPVFLVVVMLGFGACKTTKKAIHSPLVLKTAAELVSLSSQNELKFEWINAKLSANIVTKDKENTVTVNLRMRRDSAIWMSISPALGIEVARVLVTKDSIKVMDRLNSKYLVRNYAYINELLQVLVDFEMLQSLLIGNNFSYLDEKKFKSSFVDGHLYVLSTLGKRKLKKTIIEDKEINRGIMQDTWLDPENYRVVKMLIKDKKSKKELLANFEDFRLIDNQKIPFISTFDIQSFKSVKIKIEYSKILLNKVQEFPFTIPEKYEKM